MDGLLERFVPQRHLAVQSSMLANGHVESFNGRFRDECLNTNWFVNLADARRKIESWRKEYNEERPTAAWLTGHRTSSPKSAQNPPVGWLREGSIKTGIPNYVW